jgi:hypothetical protein
MVLNLLIFVLVLWCEMMLWTPLTTNLRRAKAEVLNVEKSRTKFDIIDKKTK